jgi:hypothetical protein
MTGDQCREARERLNWTRSDGKATPDFLAGYEVDLSAALESAGVVKARERVKHDLVASTKMSVARARPIGPLYDG